jgi:hypothetical protein
MGIFEGLWFELLDELNKLGRIDWNEAAADAWFARAKKGVTESETPNAVREPRFLMSSIPRERHWQSTSLVPITAKGS